VAYTTSLSGLGSVLCSSCSVAVQVRVTTLFCGQLPGVVASANVSVGAGSHASLAVGVAKLGVAGHSIVVGPGSAVIVGAVVSTKIGRASCRELGQIWSVAVT